MGGIGAGLGGVQKESPPTGFAPRTGHQLTSRCTNSCYSSPVTAELFFGLTISTRYFDLKPRGNLLKFHFRIILSVHDGE